MAIRLILSCTLVLVATLSCGGAPAHTDAPVASPSASADDTAAPAPSDSAAPPPTLPTSCSVPNGDVCTPTDDFVTRLCNARFLEATFVLFSKQSAPWTRGYLRGTVEAWNASGGASLKAKLFFDEEVLVLRRRKPAQGGIVVGDQGGYDVLRWDGYCYSLDAGEVTLKPPPQPRRGHVAFFDLAKPMQDALLATPAVTKAYAKRMKECGGATLGDVTAACEKAENALSDAAIEAARSSSTLPMPEKLP